MPSCVLAYSGGLGYFGHSGLAAGEGYESTPCTWIWGSRARTGKRFCRKAQTAGPRRLGSSMPRRTVPRLRLSRAAVAGQVRGRSTCWARRSPARLISKKCLQVAREVGADAYAHGATGKGNDQCRFQLAAEALNPQIQVIAPWRIEPFPPGVSRPQRDDRLLPRPEAFPSRPRPPSRTARTRTVCTSATRRASSRTWPSTAWSWSNSA